MGDHQDSKISSEVFAALALYRSLILDLAEQTVGRQENWPSFRTHLLGLLGEKGLFGRLRVILQGDTTSQGRERTSGSTMLVNSNL